jgi:hypothetical protein
VTHPLRRLQRAMGGKQENPTRSAPPPPFPPQRPNRALLFQDGRIVFHDSIEEPRKPADVLRLFFKWRQPDHNSWDLAVRELSERIPEIACGAMKLIDKERKTSRTFVERFAIDVTAAASGPSSNPPPSLHRNHPSCLHPAPQSPPKFPFFPPQSDASHSREKSNDLYLVGN